MKNTPSERLNRMLDSFRRRKIGVLGDFMLDEVLRGEATRISPEAPVPVVRIEGPGEAEGYPGGAGNVAANIAALGGKAVIWGVMGADESGKKLADLLRAQGISPSMLAREKGRMTPRKLRIAAHQHQLLRLDFEKLAPVLPSSRARLARSMREHLGRLDALIVSDYQKGSVDEALCASILPLAREQCVPVLVDPKPPHLAPCFQATVVTPNLREAEVMAGVAMRTGAEIESGGCKLIEKFECQHLLITRGAEGMTLLDSSGGCYVIHSRPRPVYDVTGAGDTVIATLALAMSSGASVKDAAELANVAAGRVVLKFGTAKITLKELRAALGPQMD